MKLSKKQIKIFLLLLTVLAAIKMLLQSFSLDEEYQVMMSYRQIMGDNMIDTMWEPHQTSSFLCTIFMWPYFKITGTLTGIVIYLRLAGTLVHLLVSFYIYKVMSHFLDKEPSFYLSLIFFNTIPKLIMLPEFGGMQVWFGILCFLSIIDSAEDITFTGLGSKKVRTYTKIILAGIFMCLEALSYPSCILLYIPFAAMIWYFHKGFNPIQKCLAFTATCAVIGMAYVGYFLVKLGAEVFFRNAEAILNSDLTHTFDTAAKLSTTAVNLGQYAVVFLILTAAALLIVRLPFLKRYLPKDQGVAAVGVVILLSCLHQLFIWVVQNRGYEYFQIHMAVTMCLGLWLVCFKLNPKDTFSKYMWAGAVIGIISLICVMYLTDLTLRSSIPHGMLGSICMLALFIYAAQKYSGFLYFILISFCLTACIGKGYTLRDSGYNNILQSENICRNGPAIGTITTYMGAYIYDNEYQLWQKEIPEGSKVMIATANVQSVNTIQYTFQNAEVCHYSIVDPTAYDERLLTYWSYYPEKEPEIIVLDCWFGKPLFEADSWIMQYIENDFGYTEVIDGDYVRIYKK